MININYIKQYIRDHIVEHSNKKNFGEVHTPEELIDEMLDKLPKETWTDKTKTFLDPAAGIGNFSICLIERLMNGLKDEIKDEEERYKHIIENQIYQIELQPENCEIIRKLFNPENKYKINLHCGDALNGNPWDLWHEFFE